MGEGATTLMDNQRILCESNNYDLKCQSGQERREVRELFRDQWPRKAPKVHSHGPGEDP